MLNGSPHPSALPLVCPHLDGRVVGRRIEDFDEAATYCFTCRVWVAFPELPVEQTRPPAALEGDDAGC